MMDFFKMDGYGIYVWSAYAIVFMSLIACVIRTVKRRHLIIQQLRDDNA